MALKKVVAAGGKSNAAKTYTPEGTPTSSDDVELAATSGNFEIVAGLVARSLQVASGYAKTVSGSAEVKLGGATQKEDGYILSIQGGTWTHSGLRSFVSSLTTTVQKVRVNRANLPGNCGFAGKGKYEITENVSASETAEWSVAGETGCELKLASGITYSGGTCNCLTPGKLVLNKNTVTVFVTGPGSTAWAVTGSGVVTGANESTIELRGAESGFFDKSTTETKYGTVIIGTEGTPVAPTLYGNWTVTTLRIFAAAKTIKVEKGVTLKIQSLEVPGSTKAAPVKLESSEAGKEFKIEFTGANTLTNLVVKDCVATGTEPVDEYEGEEATYKVGVTAGWAFVQIGGAVTGAISQFLGLADSVVAARLSNASVSQVAADVDLVVSRKLAKGTSSQQDASTQSVVSQKLAQGTSSQRLGDTQASASHKVGQGGAVNLAALVAAVQTVRRTTAPVSGVAALVDLFVGVKRTQAAVTQLDADAQTNIGKRTGQATVGQLLVDAQTATSRKVGQGTITQKAAAATSFSALRRSVGSIGGVAGFLQSITSGENFSGAVTNLIGFVTKLTGTRRGQAAQDQRLATVDTTTAVHKTAGVVAQQAAAAGQVQSQKIAKGSSAQTAADRQAATSQKVGQGAPVNTTSLATSEQAKRKSAGTVAQQVTAIQTITALRRGAAAVANQFSVAQLLSHAEFVSAAISQIFGTEFSLHSLKVAKGNVSQQEAASSQTAAARKSAGQVKQAALVASRVGAFRRGAGAVAQRFAASQVAERIFGPGIVKLFDRLVASLALKESGPRVALTDRVSTRVTVSDKRATRVVLKDEPVTSVRLR